MIKLMQLQQQRQLEGLMEFSIFCSQEVSRCTGDVRRQFSKQGHQAMGKAMLAEQWLQEDIHSLSSDAYKSQLQVYLGSLTQHKDQVSALYYCRAGNFGKFLVDELGKDLQIKNSPILT